MGGNAVFFARLRAVLMLAVVLTGLVGCPKPMPPPVPPDPGDGGAATCETACDRLRQLGCPAGQPTPKGVPCETVCRNIVESGVIDWDVQCVARALTCGATDRCAR